MDNHDRSDFAGLALPEIMGESAPILRLRQQAARLLDRQPVGGALPPVVIQGETGTGKGLMARALHAASARAGEPFIDVHCAAIPDSLLEAELFGYERGAFTNAFQAKPGLFHLAHKGTIFLDEIALLSKALQAKLLKVAEDRAVRRLGGTRSQTVDTWIIAATNEDLLKATRAGRFREDLYYRLAPLTLRMPPLRERGADILMLANHFLLKMRAAYRGPARVLTASAQAAMLSYSWPGNVRELLKVVERVVLLSNDSMITADALELDGPSVDTGATPVEAVAQPRGRGFRRRVDRAQLEEIFQGADWKLSVAASRLGVPRNTLRYWAVKLDLRPRGRDTIPAAADLDVTRSANPDPVTRGLPGPHEYVTSGDVKGHRPASARLATHGTRPPIAIWR